MIPRRGKRCGGAGVCAACRLLEDSVALPETDPLYSGSEAAYGRPEDAVSVPHDSSPWL